MSYDTNVKLGFENLVPRNVYQVSAAYYDGYQGFNFTDMELLTKLGIEHFGWENTGFSAVLHGDAEAYTQLYLSKLNQYYSYGRLSSAYAGETFNLKSGIFASAAQEQEYVSFKSFEANGRLKGSVHFFLFPGATTINFANYGSDFKNIAAVKIFGAGGNVFMDYYYQVAMDNLKVHWNGAIPGSGAMRHHAHVSHPTLAAMADHDHHATGNLDGGASGADGHHNAGYHSELASLVSLSHHGGGLTSKFSLPQTDHFGT